MAEWGAGGGETLPTRRLSSAILFVLFALAASGCGETNGVGPGATVTAYVVAPLCAEAEMALARHGAEVGEVRVRVACLPSSEHGEKQDLAAIGAGARRASEDSTSIAYIATTDPIAVRFSETILEEANIPQLPTSSGERAMAKLIHAVAEAGNASNLRASVNQSLTSG